MLQLTLAGLSEDGKRLLLVSDSGQEFSLEIDNRLRATLRGERIRFGQLEIHMESTLRPRDIQARIRAGESAESVAQAASTTVDKILPFADPVLAERAHVAQRAQRSSVRRQAGDQGARTLGDAAQAQLLPHNVSPDDIEWDAWRREDGRWALTADYDTDERTGTAKFTFDTPGNYVTVDNDDARWLVGEAPGAGRSSGAAPAGDDLQQARQRRLSAVPEDELPLGDDAIGLVTDPEAPELAPTPEPLTEEPSTEPESAPPEPREPESTEAESTEQDSATDQTTAGQAGAEQDDQVEPEPKPRAKPQPKKTSKRKGRASVPSWDEIMFGGGKQD